MSVRWHVLQAERIRDREAKAKGGEMVVTITSPDEAREVLEQALLYLAEEDGYQKDDLREFVWETVKYIYESGDR